jgi:hypothetical protein
MARAIRQTASARAPGGPTAGARGEIGARSAAGRAQHMVAAQARAALDRREGGRGMIAGTTWDSAWSGVARVKVEERRGGWGGGHAVR